MYRSTLFKTISLQSKIALLLISLASLFCISTQAQVTVTLPDCADCDPQIDALDCSTATFNNNEFSTGELFQASMLVPYTGGNGQAVGELSINSTGVTGLTADLVGNNLVSGSGNLIFYIQGNPSGEGTASFEVSFAGQTCTADLTLTETAVTSASSSGGRCKLTSAKQIYGSFTNLFILDDDGYLWVEGSLGLRGSTLLPFNDDGLTSQNRSRTFIMPTRLKHPYFGTPNEVVFEEILTANTEYNEPYIVARAADGKVWGWSLAHSGASNSDFADGMIICKNCSGAASTERDFHFTNGWGRMVTPNGDNLIDFTMVTSLGKASIALDTNGKLWAATSELASPTTGTNTNYAGLGMPVSRSHSDPSYMPITIPNDDPIVKIESYAAASSIHGIIALSASGKLYGWGTDVLLGYTNTPTELPLPNAGVTAVDIERYKTGVWIEGSDEKLYYVGGGDHRQFIAGSDANPKGQPQEVQGWTNLGVGLDYLISGGGSNGNGWAFMGTDGKMYFANTHPANNPAPGFGYGTNFDLVPYEDLSPDANLDYSSGMIGFAYNAGHTDGHFLLTKDVLVVGQHHSLLKVYQGLHGTLFPNVDFIQFCYEHTVPNLDYAPGGQYQYRLETRTISSPPNGQ